MDIGIIDAAVVRVKLVSFAPKPNLPVFNPAPFRDAGKAASREAQSRAKLQGLFKEGGAPAADFTTDARAKLDALFRKPKRREDAG